MPLRFDEWWDKYFAWRPRYERCLGPVHMKLRSSNHKGGKSWAGLMLRRNANSPANPLWASQWPPIPLHRINVATALPRPPHQSPWPTAASNPPSHCQLLSQSAAAQQRRAWQSLTLPASSLSTLDLSNYCQHKPEGVGVGGGRGKGAKSGCGA